MKRNSDSEDDRKMPAKKDNQLPPDQREEAADAKSTSDAAGILDALPGSVAQKQPPVAAAAAAKQNEKPAKRKPGTSKQAGKSSKKAKTFPQQRGPLPPSHLPGYNFRPHDNLTLSGGRQSVKYVVKSSFAPEVIARAAGTEKHGRSPGSSRHEDTEVPENETAEEKRLRRNRINERRKRARRAMKIDYLNEQYHNITTDNERIREENQFLRDQIEDVRNGRMPQGFQDNEGAAQVRENMVGTADAPPDVASSSADTTALACLQQPQAQAQTPPLPESDLARALAILHGTQQSISHSTADTKQTAVQPQVPTQNSGTSQLLESALAKLLQRGLQQSETSSTATQGMTTAQQGSGMLTGASQANENIRNTMGIRENTATDSHSRNTTGSTVALLQSLLSRESFNSAVAVLVGNSSTRNSTSSTTGTVGSGSMRHSAAVAPTATSTTRGLAAPPLSVTSSASSAEQNLLVLLSDHLQQQDQTAGASFNATSLSRLQDALSTTASQGSRQPEPAQSSNARPAVPHNQQGAPADILALILQQQQNGAMGNSQVQGQGQRHVQQHGQPVNQNQLQQLESSLQQLLRGRQQPGGAAAAPRQRVVEHQQNQERQRRSELQEQLQQLVLQNERQQQQRQDQQSSQIQELQRFLALQQQQQQQEEEQRRQRQESIQIQELRQLLVLQQQQEQLRQQEQQQEQQRQQQRERQQLQIGMERQRQQENVRIRELQHLLLLQQQRQGQGHRENASTVQSSPLQQLHRHHAQASNAAPAPPPSPLNALSGGIDLRQLLLQQQQDAGTNARLQPAARHDMSATSAGPGEESKTGGRIDFKAEDHNYDDGPRQK